MNLAGFRGNPPLACLQNIGKSNPINGGIMTNHLLNKLTCVLSALVLLLGLATAHGGVSSMNVTVFDANSKVVFRGPMSANATFATPSLQPGDYVVQFNAEKREVINNRYLLVVSASSKKVIATDVAGGKFITGGVAMRIAVGPDSNITGQVAPEQAVTRRDGQTYRVIDGKRYYWVSGELGSNRGGRWVEETLGAGGNLTAWSKDSIRKIQDTGGEGSMIGYYGRYNTTTGSRGY